MLKTLKKCLSTTLVFTLLFCLLTGCSSDNATGTKNNINIGCMKGPTAIGMIKLLSDSDSGLAQNQYSYTIAGTADELTASLINGNLNFAAVPCNLASVLYHKTEGEIVTVAVNTLGVLYIVAEDNSIQTVHDLKGKTIYSTGQGTTPEYTLRFLLSSAGLNPDTDVTIQYMSEASEVVAMLSQTPDAVAMLPQPYVTVALNNNSNLNIVLDITKEWEKVSDCTVVTGVIVARKTYIEEHPDALQSFLNEYRASTEYANSNIEDTATLLENYDIFKAAIAMQAIPHCNVTYMSGEEMKQNVLDYLNILYEQNPAAVGGKTPEEGMFYIETK